MLAVGARKRQRYTFKDESQRLKDYYRAALPTSSTSAVVAFAVDPGQRLNNSLTTLTGAFIGTVSPTIDVSYQLAGNFGGFLNEVPKRLGRNEALDAAAEALVAGYKRYRSGFREPNADLLIKHSRALTALHRCIDVPAKAKTPETLCAVMMLPICELFMGANKAPAMHYRGAIQFLNDRRSQNPSDDLERVVLSALRGPALVEALVGSDMRHNRREWKSLVITGVSNGPTDTALMNQLARLTHVVSSCREVLRPESQKPSPNPHEVLLELYCVQSTFIPILNDLRNRWQQRNKSRTSADGAQLTLEARRSHCYALRTLASALSLNLILNNQQTLLQGPSAAVKQHSAQLASEILELAEQADIYRPLGSLAMCLFLNAASVGAGDQETRERILRKETELCKDVWGEDVMFEVLTGNMSYGTKTGQRGDPSGHWSR
ncbi:uncharacterized protein KY384_007288 [Bacidia gigantensis]|uniref:uncharacterized protein n=1 Tax=Bacidia gigantensis TaxID=2732470 RepID=UPI001D057597|nr:uncharacterized protein KY384_007288 [Bacidia gigantensis]KAG8528370.1 hypothetical protein KY384_007288 [Bacidia gigantensis]